MYQPNQPACLRLCLHVGGRRRWAYTFLVGRIRLCSVLLILACINSCTRVTSEWRGDESATGGDLWDVVLSLNSRTGWFFLFLVLVFHPSLSKNSPVLPQHTHTCQPYSEEGRDVYSSCPNSPISFLPKPEVLMSILEFANALNRVAGLGTLFILARKSGLFLW